ncbi:MAG: DUF2764 family protein [Alistipes sp.]
MFESNYYCLVAGLREYAPDADAKGFDAQEIIEEIFEGISAADARAVRLLYSYYDCENLIAFRHGSSAHNALGNLTHAEVEQAMQTAEGLPAEVAQVVRAYANAEGEEAELIDTGRRFETVLMEAYYTACSHSKSRFIREWSAFDRNLRNITAAVAARAANRPIEEVTVGDGEVVEQLQRSSAADFSLRGELSYIDALIAAMNDETNLVEKEHKIDLIRWNEATGIATFDYFNINAILSYLTKINIVARWTVLDERQGRAMFERLLAELDGKELINKQQ